jgi:RNA polymerase sigma-70 factor (ECF subfamily)
MPQRTYAIAQASSPDISKKVRTPLLAPQEDLELAERHRKGDPSAFVEFVDTYSSLIHNVAFRMTGNREDALDLCQDVLLKVYASLGGYRGRASLCSWTYRITMNAARNHVRWWTRAKRGKTYSLDEAEEERQPLSERVISPGPSSEARVYASEIGARIQQALNTLPVGQRAAVVLRDVQGLDYYEIASTLGISLGTVKSRLARGREALRRELADLME